MINNANLNTNQNNNTNNTGTNSRNIESTNQKKVNPYMQSS